MASVSPCPWLSIPGLVPGSSAANWCVDLAASFLEASSRAGPPLGEGAEDSEVEREGAPCMGGAVNSSAGLRGRTDPSSGEPENW